MEAQPTGSFGWRAGFVADGESFVIEEFEFQREEAFKRCVFRYLVGVK
jgi:hypothetical protein